MGVNLRDLLEYKQIELSDLKGKVLVVDGNNMLYQFLSTIRQRDGSLFTDHKGRVTSHLIGLFSRVTNIMGKGVKLAFVFDGKMPELKRKEVQRRAEAKEMAAQKYARALEEEDVEEMKKYAARTSRLSKDMISDAIRLLELLGLPIVQAPSEGEAQAAHMVAKGDAWATASQDYDSLLFGSSRLVQNLSIEGRRKVPGRHVYKIVKPKLFVLEDNLKALGITREKLIWLAILIGCDYAPSGVKGIGPKKGLALVQKCSSAEELFEKVELADDVDWRDVLSLFENMPVTDDYSLTWGPVKRKDVEHLLVEEHDFGRERVNNVLDKISAKKGQSLLGDF